MARPGPHTFEKVIGDTQSFRLEGLKYPLKSYVTPYTPGPGRPSALLMDLH